MQIAVGYEFIWELPKPTPMLLTVHIHYSRASDLAVVDNLASSLLGVGRNVLTLFV